MTADRDSEFDSDFFQKNATFDHYLDSGAFGKVYGPVRWHGLQLALKEVMFADGKVTVDFRKCIEEKKVIWTSLEHKNLIKIHYADLTRLAIVGLMYIVMDYAAGGSLLKTLRSLRHGVKLPIDVVTDWSTQIAEGMLYLHERNIVHRDLKSSNILLMESFDIQNSHALVTLKIADFDDIKEHNHTATVSFRGTLAYMAPELRVTERFSKASDVWSFGVVIWEMLTGEIPYNGLDSKALLVKSAKGEMDKLPLGQLFSEDYKLILKRCWRSSSKKRLSFSEIFCVLHRMAEEKDVTEILKFKGNMLQKYFPDVPRVTENYKSDPILFGTIRTEEEKKSIRGLTILDKELFVVIRSHSEIEVYNTITFSLSRSLKLMELVSAWDIVSCNKNKCLYIFDNKDTELSREIMRVEPNGNLIKKWSTGNDYGHGMSVTDESNVLLTVFNNHKLIEYSSDGQLIREIYLLSDAGIRFPQHAVKLADGNFIVCHGSIADNLYRVCIVDANGKLVKSFGGKCGYNNAQVDDPFYLSVDGNGFVFVVDQGNGRILLLDSNLKFQKEILTKGKHQLRRPSQFLMDESTRLALVVESTFDSFGLIMIFQF